VVSAALSTRHAFAEADNLKWDLTYQTALDDHPIDGSEWMASWPKWFAKRALTDELAAYSGEQIDASLLIETPNPHAGDPDAIWFFKTKTSAHTCSFSVRVMSPCKQVDPARTEIFIREVMNYKQVQFTPVKEKWNGMLMNYFGFLSAYVDGRTLQRPIATIELFESLAKQSTEAADVARLTRAVEEQMRAALADEDQAMVEEALRWEASHLRGSSPR
jgi:hypothetical protein